MRVLSYAIAICGLWFFGLPASAAAADITGTWELTIHYPPPDGDFTATYVLKQDGEKITGTYHGLRGPADVTGTIKGNDVVLTVTVPGTRTGRLSGKVKSVTQMSGTMTMEGMQRQVPWSAEKKK
jgi:hypothetical protein